MIIILISILKNLVSFLFQTAQHHTGQAFLQLINLNLSRWNLQNQPANLLCGFIKFAI